MLSLRNIINTLRSSLCLLFFLFTLFFFLFIISILLLIIFWSFFYIVICSFFSHIFFNIAIILIYIFNALDFTHFNATFLVIKD
jgi:hypothetical protein